MRVLEQGTHPPFGVGLMVSVGISLWSARYATGTLMTALNVTHAVSDERGLVLFNAVALSLTVALIVLAGGAVILIAVIPLLLSYLPIPTGWQAAAMLIQWPLLVCMIIAIVALLYRYAPNRSEPRWGPCVGRRPPRNNRFDCGFIRILNVCEHVRRLSKDLRIARRSCRVDDMALGRGLFHPGGRQNSTLRSEGGCLSDSVWRIIGGWQRQNLFGESTHWTCPHHQSK
ncbi:hypothetical protein BSZ21_38515 [Bradyrhizobium canariense]|nr:hypothetical protein BSZ21_38515 [Bradyrhizobium canariense]